MFPSVWVQMLLEDRGGRGAWIASQRTLKLLAVYISLTSQVPTIWGTIEPLGPYIVGTWAVRVWCIHECLNLLGLVLEG